MFSSDTFPVLEDRRHHLVGKGRRPAVRSARRDRRLATPLIAAAVDGVLVIAIVAAVLLFQGGDEPVPVVMAIGLAIAAMTVAVAVFREDYAVETLAAPRGHATRAMLGWSIGYGCAMLLVNIAGAWAPVMRGCTGLVFVGGLMTLPVARMAVSRVLGERPAGAAAAARRVLVVAAECLVDALELTEEDGRGSHVVGRYVLRDDATTRAEDLALAVAVARMLSPDDIVLVLPWDDHARVEATVAALRQLPADIHLGPPASLSGATGPGGFALVRRPLSRLDLRLKRMFDILLAGAALLLLSPVLLLATLAIKLDSRGPVLFMQRRYGFNQQPFRIMKFRSMSVMEDGAGLRQVTAGDRRVTRVGRFLRRTSIDELPQLINVLRGDMSLIGPRPHALAHDQQFERMVALYGRRHNVRPGITGWAQVRGFRGEIDTPEKIEGRVRHDLDYIDNWSLWFDLSILFRTVFSRQTFHNAK